MIVVVESKIKKSAERLSQTRRDIYSVRRDCHSCHNYRRPTRTRTYLLLDPAKTQLGPALSSCSITMPDSAIFNANPTIFLTSKSSGRKTTSSKSLWMDENEEQDGFEEDGNELELIDQDEIYGSPISL